MQNISPQRAAKYFSCKLIREDAETHWQTMAVHSELCLPHLINFMHAPTTQTKVSREAFTSAFSWLSYKMWAKWAADIMQM